MNLPQGKRSQWNYLALAFGIPFLGMIGFMLVQGFVPFGNRSFLYSDCYHQYYPFFLDLRRALRSGDGLLYNWNIGLGMDYLGLIAYYAASPLNLLSVLLPEEWMLAYFDLLTPVRLGLAGLCFAIFLKGIFGKNDLSISLFGGMYGLCAWALGFQWNVMWLDTFALLPLVVLGTVRLIREKRFLLYTWSLALSIFSNYYIGLFTCIFVFLLFFVYQFCRWGGWKKFLGDLVRIAFFSALAIGMTAILELPAFFALMDTQSTVNKFPTGFVLNIVSEHNWKGLLDGMRRIAGNMGGGVKPNFVEGLPNVYCGVLSMMLAFQYLLAGKVRLRDKLCAAGLLVFFMLSFLIRQLDYIWHGFHFTNMIPYRFSFLYSFVVLYMAYRAYLLRRRMKLWQILLCGALTAAVLLCSEDISQTQTVQLGSLEFEMPVYAVYNLAFLGCYVGALLYGNSAGKPARGAEEEAWAAYRAKRRDRLRRCRTALAVLICLEMVANLCSFGIHFGGTNMSNYPSGGEYTASVIRYMKEREKGDLFYRAETTHAQILNDGALNDYHGITAFTSSANVKTTQFMRSLGYSAMNTYNRYLFEESSPVANLFLGLKYMIERDGRDRSSSLFQEVNKFGNAVLLENQAYLPLGFLTEPELAQVELDTEGEFEYQNEIFQAATGLTAPVWHLVADENVTVDSLNVTIENIGAGGTVRYRDAEANGEVIYRFTAQRDGFACLQIDLPKRNKYYVSINDRDLYSETISLDQMIAVGDVKAGDVIGVRVVCKAEESSTMELKAAIMDPEVFWEGYEILNASVWELDSFENTRVSGTITCDRDGLLYTSIPQNGNWFVEVDGEAAETVLVGDCMTAVELTQGTHRVTYVYRNAAFDWGWKISAVCILIFLGLMRQERKRRRRRPRYLAKK